MPSYRETEIAKAYRASNTERLEALIAEVERDRKAELDGYKLQADYRRKAINEAKAVLKGDLPTADGSCDARVQASGWRHPASCGNAAKVIRNYQTTPWQPGAVKESRTVKLCGLHRKVRGEYGMPYNKAEDIQQALDELQATR